MLYETIYDTEWCWEHGLLEGLCQELMENQMIDYYEHFKSKCKLLVRWTREQEEQSREMIEQFLKY